MCTCMRNIYIIKNIYIYAHNNEYIHDEDKSTKKYMIYIYIYMIYIYINICMKNVHIIKYTYTYKECTHNEEYKHIIISNIYECEGYIHNKEYIQM